MIPLLCLVALVAQLVWFVISVERALARLTRPRPRENRRRLTRPRLGRVPARVRYLQPIRPAGSSTR